MERRAKSRIDVQLVCSVDPSNVEAKAIRTLTENVSRTGILMSWDAATPPPQVDQNMVVNIHLPENSEFGPRVMRCNATVVRVHPGNSEEYEVALRIRRVAFVKPKSVRNAEHLASMPIPTHHVI